MTRWGLVALTLSLTASSCDCGKRGAKHAQPEPARETDAGLSVPVKLRDFIPERKLVHYADPVVLPRLEKIELLAPGKGPRRRYRYQSAGPERELRITANIRSRDLDGAKWSDRLTLPEIRYGLGVQPAPGPKGAAGSKDAARSGTAAGTGTGPAPAAGKPASGGAVDRNAQGAAGRELLIRGIKAEIGDPPAGGDPRWTAAARRAADEFLARYRAFVERQRVTARVDARGVLLGVTPPADGGNSAAFTKREVELLLLESLVPLPEQAIGPGAKWRVTWLLWRGAAAVKQVATYELVSSAGGRLQLAASIRQIGEHQVVQAGAQPGPGVALQAQARGEAGQKAAGLPGSATVELLVLFFKAHGTVKLDLAAVTPSSAQLEVELRVHTRVRDHGASRDYFVESTGTVQLASSPRD